MSMQVCCVDPQPQSTPYIPPSDVEKMKTEIPKIFSCLANIKEGKADDSTYDSIIDALLTLNDLIHSLDNANDFFKIGGFNLLPLLLECPKADVVAATAELIADLCQNNVYCQQKSLEFDLLPKLVELIKSNNTRICLKALYALSCLCRHSNEAILHLESQNIIPVLLEILQRNDERLRIKTAFFLTHLISHDHFRDALFEADLLKILIQLLTEQDDSTCEHLLNALLAQTSKHKLSRIECRKVEYHLEELLLSKIQFYEGKEEYREAYECCKKILDVCFHES